MKHARGLIFLLALLAAFPANACQWASDDAYRAGVRNDLKRQKALVLELEQQADQILVARASLETDGFSYAGSVDVLETIKGGKVARLPVKAEAPIIVSCVPSESFRNVGMVAGTVYLLYVRNGVVLRAAPKQRDPAEISFRRERRLLLRPNNSFKPKPLRGSA